MKNKLRSINELSAYRLLFICACVLSLAVGILAINNTVSLMQMNQSLSVGEYQDKAELIKATNDTECLYGSLNPEDYSFNTQQAVALDCIQYSRDLHTHYLQAGNDTEFPDISLNYDFAAVKTIMEFCVTDEAKNGGTKTIQIGTVGESLLSCKDDAVKGKQAIFSSAN